MRSRCARSGAGTSDPNAARAAVKAPRRLWRIEGHTSSVRGAASVDLFRIERATHDDYRHSRDAKAAFDCFRPWTGHQSIRHESCRRRGPGGFQIDIVQTHRVSIARSATELLGRGVRAMTHGRSRLRAAHLRRDFYAQRTLAVARQLIGMHLVHRDGRHLRVGRIVETEAYQGPHDLVAHSARGRRTARTEVMFGAPGHAYVYLIYGMWDCLNIVTGAEGTPHAVLLRALEPVAGIDDRTSGPGLLCRAMRIDRRLNGADLCGTRLWIERPATMRTPRIASGPRIGVAYAMEWALKRWRFFDAESGFVSARVS